MMKVLAIDYFKICLMLITCGMICFYSIEHYKERKAIEDLVNIKTEDRYKGVDAKRDLTVRDQAIQNLDKRVKELEKKSTQRLMKFSLVYLTTLCLLSYYHYLNLYLDLYLRFLPYIILVPTS